MGWLKEIFKGSTSHQDQDGQPLVKNYRSHAVGARKVDELIGLIKGVLADGVVCQAEAEFLLKWMQTNQTATNEWPANVLLPRIAAALEDGVMDKQEESEIFELLQTAVGNNDAIEQGWSSGSSSLPLNDPAPTIEAQGRIFCFTGKFNTGTRDWCHQQIITLGGDVAKGITKKLDYLVIGEIGSRDWLHSTHGRKILKAVEYRDAGVPLCIVSERHWHSQLLA